MTPPPISLFATLTGYPPLLASYRKLFYPRCRDSIKVSRRRLAVLETGLIFDLESPDFLGQSRGPAEVAD
jgi:hypothetical protein